MEKNESKPNPILEKALMEIGSEQAALALKTFYDSLINSGFKKEQSMQIVLQTLDSSIKYNQSK